MTYTRAETDAAIQAAADAKGEPLSMAAYRAFRKEQGGREVRIPTLETIIRTDAGHES